MMDINQITLTKSVYLLNIENGYYLADGRH